MRRVGEINVVRPFLEEANFRKFAQSTKMIENHINMNNLDAKTKEVIKYYKKIIEENEGGSHNEKEE